MTNLANRSIFRKVTEIIDGKIGRNLRKNTLFSCGTKLPYKINIVPAKIGERNCIDNYTSDKNTLYLFDKG